MIKFIFISAFVVGILTGMISGNFGTSVFMFIFSLLIGFLTWGAIELLKHIFK